MATNPYVNKIVINNTIKLDLTSDTVTPNNVLLGVTAHNAAGAAITGTMANNKAVSATISTQGGTYTIPSGYHNGNGVITASIAAGSAKPASSITGSSATASLSGTTLTLTKSISNTPRVTAGYIASGTADSTSVSLSGTVPTETKSATDNGTITPTSGKLLSSVTVNVPYSIYRTGSGAPSSSLGNDGDIYIDIG